VTVFVSKSELGQGIHTALAMILAEELSTDWSRVQVQMPPVIKKYADPVTGYHGTDSSNSIQNLYQPLRLAGAAGREMLLGAASSRWKVDVGECQASRSRVYHRASGRSFSYGELCEEARSLPVPKEPRLKDKEEFEIMRTPLIRLDIPAKVSGQARFGTDTFVPNMLYGAVARPPAWGAQAVSYNQGAAQEIAGVQEVVELASGIAVCADTLETAWEAREALDVQWNEGIQPSLTSESLQNLLEQSLDRKGVSAREDGDVRGALIKAHRKIQAEYFLPFLSHFTMEPMNCVVKVGPDRCDVWAPTQAQSVALLKTAKITGLKPDQVHIHTPYVGGGFGRRAQLGFLEEAVELSKTTGRPVKVIWKREEDMQYGYYRPGNSCRIEGAIDERGRLTAWSHRVATPSVLASLLEDYPQAGGAAEVDHAAVSGLEDLQYEVPNLSVEYVKVETPVPVYPWRSVGNSHNGFTVESFMDELAHAARQDPLEFRLHHLKHNPRAHRVLQVAAQKAGWGKPLAHAQAQGIASYAANGSYLTQVAEVSVDERTGKIKVHRVVCAVDCGPFVNPDTVASQIEGAITMGLSAALKEQVEFGNGGATSANLLDYTLLRMSEAPDVEVHIVDSEGEIGGIGEPGLPLIAPAVANAVFAAVGARIRRLPMTAERVLEAIRNG
jgi:isoquinoline 1-oxidoreductase beta subunit